MRKDSGNSRNIDLLDLNVWLALVDENHIHHSAAASYWSAANSGRAAFCRVTMLGFLRLSGQPGVLSKPLSVTEAWNAYAALRALPEIVFLPEPGDVEEHMEVLIIGHDLPRQLLTDGYLAAFSIATQSRLVSFDADCGRFPGVDFLHLQRSTKG